MAFSSPATPNIGRVAAVTGANKGIGFYIALQLATSGLFTNIILGCRDSIRGEKAVQEIKRQLSSTSTSTSTSTSISTSISYVPLVLGDGNSHKLFQQSIEHSFGKLDVLVNNAAMAYKNTDPTPFKEQCTPTLDINFCGTLHLTEELLPLIRKGDDARIVNVASMAGRLNQIKSKELRKKISSDELTLEELLSMVDKYEKDVLDGVHLEEGWGNSNYGMSKLALIAATRVLARMEDGIKVNAICPG